MYLTNIIATCHDSYFPSITRQFNITHAVNALTAFKFGSCSPRNWIKIFGNTLFFFIKYSRHTQYWELLNHINRFRLCPKLRYDDDAKLRYADDAQLRYDDYIIQLRNEIENNRRSEVDISRRGEVDISRRSQADISRRSEVGHLRRSEVWHRRRKEVGHPRCSKVWGF